MNEKSNKPEKLTSHQDDELSTSDEDNSESNTDGSQTKDSERQTSKLESKKPERQTLASFFKTKAERENEKDNASKVKPPVDIAQTRPAELSESTEHTQRNIEDEEQEENLTNQEVQEVTIAIVDARTQEVSEELDVAEPDSVDEFEALADAVFLESLQDLATNETEVTPELIDVAFDEALEYLSITGEIEEADNATEIEPPETTEVIVDQDKDDKTVAAVEPDTPPIAPPAPTGPFTQPAGPGGPPTPGGSYNFTAPYNPNVAQNNPNTQPIIIQEIHNHHSDLLLGAILGYIIGRRGGRKRTEKQLIPKIEKLQEQVKTLHDTIIEKEVQIRKVARENAETIKCKLELNSAKSPVSATLIMERRKTSKELKETLRRREILASDPGVEKIGKFSLPALKIFHERRLPDGTENSQDRKRVEVMNEAELLDKAQLIVIHNLSVVEMYQRSRLTLESLRQVTKEYLRSGPYEQTFLRELLPDPELINQKRDQVAQTESTTDHQNLREIYSNQTVAHHASNDQPTSTSDKKAQTPLKKMVVSGAITGIVIAAIAAVALIIS